MEEVVPFLFDDFFFSRIHVIVNIDWHKNGLKRAISEIGNPFLLMVFFPRIDVIVKTDGHKNGLSTL